MNRSKLRKVWKVWASAFMTSSPTSKDTVLPHHTVNKCHFYHFHFVFVFILLHVLGFPGYYLTYSVLCSTVVLLCKNRKWIYMPRTIAISSVLHRLSMCYIPKAKSFQQFCFGFPERDDVWLLLLSLLVVILNIKLTGVPH